MKHLGLFWICLAGLGVLAGPLASSASAAPEWWSCAKAEPKNTGHYSDKLCSSAVESGGKYELKPGIGKGKAFKGKTKGGAARVLDVVIPGKAELWLECESVDESGRVAAPNRVFGVTLAFSKCRMLGGPCSSFTTAALAGELGWVNKETGVIGVSLTDEAAPGTGYIAQFECPGVAKFRVFGSFIGTQTGDVGHVSTSATTEWRGGPFNGGPGHENEVVNVPRSFEEGPTEVLLAEVNSVESHGIWVPEGGYLGALERTIPTRGEALLIQ